MSAVGLEEPIEILLSPFEVLAESVGDAAEGMRYRERFERGKEDGMEDVFVNEKTDDDA